MHILLVVDSTIARHQICEYYYSHKRSTNQPVMETWIIKLIKNVIFSHHGYDTACQCSQKAHIRCFWEMSSITVRKDCSLKKLQADHLR